MKRFTDALCSEVGATAKRDRVRNRLKIRIYRSVIRPIVTHSTEARTDNSKAKQIMKTTEMRTLRNVVGKMKAGLIITQGIKRQCNGQRIGEWTSRRGDENVSRMAP
jgi:hypothetical protein